MKNRIMLTKAEKDEARKKLASFMKENPVRNYGDVRLGGWATKINTLIYNLYSVTIKPMNTMFTKPLALVMALVVVGSGGTVFASQDAQPGDALYGIKTHFNEPVREFLALNPEAKADFAITRVERRLLEAEGLTAKDELTPELEQELKDLINDHIDELTKYLEKVQAESGDEKLVGLNQKLENLVGNYEKKLAKLEGDTEEQTSQKEKVRGLFEKVKEDKEKMKDLIQKMKDERVEDEDGDSDENVVKDQAAAEGKMTAAQNKLDEVEKYLIANKGSMSASDYEDAVDKLIKAKLVFEDAQKALTDADYANAFDMFKDAMEKVQDVKKEVNPGVKDLRQEDKTQKEEGETVKQEERTREQEQKMIQKEEKVKDVETQDDSSDDSSVEDSQAEDDSQDKKEVEQEDKSQEQEDEVETEVEDD